MARLTRLVQAFQAGDETVLRQIVDLTRTRLIRFAVLLGTRLETAEDLCQETYLKAFRSISTLKDPSKAMSWLYSVLRNLWVDHHRLASNRNEQAAESPEDYLQPDTPAASREDFVYVQELLQALDPADRSVMLLVHMEGYSYKEAAEASGITEEAVRLTLRRARRQLLKKSEGRDPKSAAKTSND